MAIEFKPADHLAIVKIAKEKQEKMSTDYGNPAHHGQHNAIQEASKEVCKGVIVGLGKEVSAKGYKKGDKVMFTASYGEKFEVNGVCHRKVYCDDILGKY